jgi:two-component system chemotaxis response regulator CheY
VATPNTLKILIVEDDRTSRFVLRRMIEALGDHEIHEAEDGLRAWEKLDAGLVPDLCFLDFNMPRMNGVELLRRIRVDSRWGKMRVCFCSVVRDRNLVFQAAVLKPNDYILKPYTRETIQAQVQRALGAPNPAESLEVADNVCTRLGIDHSTYLNRLNGLLQEVREAIGRLPTMLMRFDIGSVITTLERMRSQSQQLGIRRIAKLSDSLLRIFESSGGSRSQRDVTREEAAGHFQQWLSQSADQVMQSIQDLRTEVLNIERIGSQAFRNAAAGIGPDNKQTTSEQLERDELIQVLSDVFQQGKLIAAARTSKSRSLSVPVKASLLGKDSAKTLGTLTSKVSFSLTILDPETGKAVEDCRKITDLLKFLSLPLDSSTRWIPDAAVRMLESERSSRNEQGILLLRHAIGSDLDAFMVKQEAAIRENLAMFYAQSGAEGGPSEEQVQEIVSDVRERLQPAVDGQLTSEVSYTVLDLGNLAEAKEDERWASPRSLLYHTAVLHRRALADPAFDRAFKFSTFDRKTFLKAMDVFGDSCGCCVDRERAAKELQQLEDIEASPVSEFEKCRMIWAIIKFQPANPKESPLGTLPAPAAAAAAAAAASSREFAPSAITESADI